ncbi:hypothetical protein Gasu2_43300 [Galdieria sulphuraria]|uniref:Uncharacterized protein n=1 Tax=Galdieria sulphuraria TaxID=130081 RepID=M2XVM8_GALSU|nr:uncharacterized protein Gasu_46980 [Galdieria sulphuraria]EME27708.1 hypothetical protein Gasu_46980 [Galdieria sulphuraria]GJD10118.1 hypothetical protein Gasu2_43300 [Galdieria sulphuraria]|eukprot:XP_005704228.1 hypothetical protein Gasu_46980 [Galdieria sulphuraria]
MPWLAAIRMAIEKPRFEPSKRLYSGTAFRVSSNLTEFPGVQEAGTETVNILKSLTRRPSNGNFYETFLRLETVLQGTSSDSERKVENILNTLMTAASRLWGDQSIKLLKRT